MRITTGYWLSLTNRHTSQVIYQCVTDVLTDEEFLTLWQQAGKIMLHTLKDSENNQMEFEIRAMRSY